MNRLRGWLLRAPVHLYRAGLGFLLGRRFLLLEHIGRRTGAQRRAVLEVVAERDGSPVVVSGFGSDSDWVKNVSANPAVSITWGARTFRAVAHTLDRVSARDVLEEYRRDHPRAAAALGRALGVSLDDIDGAVDVLPVLRFGPAPTRR